MRDAGLDPIIIITRMPESTPMFVQTGVTHTAYVAQSTKIRTIIKMRSITILATKIEEKKYKKYLKASDIF